MLLNVLIGLVAFWTLEMNGFRMIYRLVGNFATGALIPLWFMPDLMRAIAGAVAREELRLGLLRDGQPAEIEVRAFRRPDESGGRKPMPMGISQGMSRLARCRSKRCSKKNSSSRPNKVSLSNRSRPNRARRRSQALRPSNRSRHSRRHNKSLASSASSLRSPFSSMMWA